jgi:hypothetical protein
MKILDENGNEILNPDLTKGHLEPDKLTIHHDAVVGVSEQSHIEVIKEYPNGGKDVKKVIDVPGVPGCDAYDEYEDIQRYIPYTAAELAEIEKRKNGSGGRITAVPDDWRECIMSAIANFLMVQYKLGNVTVEQINSLVGKSLTQAEADEIIKSNISD